MIMIKPARVCLLRYSLAAQDETNVCDQKAAVRGRLSETSEGGAVRRPHEAGISRFKRFSAKASPFSSLR